MKFLLVVWGCMTLDVYFFYHAQEIKYTPTKMWFRWLPVSGLILFAWTVYKTTEHDASEKQP